MDRDDWRHCNACIRCHTLKLKCRRPFDQPTCIRCAKHNVTCKPRPPKRCTTKGQQTLSSKSTEDTMSWSLPFPISLPDDGRTTPTITTGQSRPESVDWSPGTSDMFDTSYAAEAPHGWFEDVLSNGTLYGTLPTPISPVSTGDTTLSDTHIPRSTAVGLDTTTNELVDIQPCMSDDSAPCRLLPSSNLPVLQDWLDELGQLTREVFAHRMNTALAASQGASLLQNSTTSASTPEQDSVCPILTLTAKFSALMEAIIPGNSRTTAIPGEPCSPRILNILFEDQSNGMLLSSTYLRLLGILSTMLEDLSRRLSRRFSTVEGAAGTEHGLGDSLSQAGVDVMFQGLAKQPVVAAFLFVNLIELHVHRIARCLGRLAGPVRSGSDLADVGEAAAVQCKGTHGVVPEVVFERQAMLLEDTRKLRDELLKTRGT